MRHSLCLIALLLLLCVNCWGVPVLERSTVTVKEGKKQDSAEEPDKEARPPTKREIERSQEKDTKPKEPKELKEPKENDEKGTDKARNRDRNESNGNVTPSPQPTGKDTRNMSTSEMLAEARAHSAKFMKGGIIEFIEWLFVFILVAPGTFPAIGCVILSCTSFWRRRLQGSNEEVQEEDDGEERPVSVRAAERDNLVARARAKEDREAEPA